MSEVLHYQSRGRPKEKPLPTARDIRIYRWMMLPLVFVSMAAAVLCLWSQRASLNMFFLEDALPFVTVSGALPVLMAVGWMIRLIRFRETRRARLQALGWVFTPIAVLFATLTLIFFNLPLKCSLLLSAPAIRALTAEVRAHPGTIIFPRSVALFRVDDIQLDGTKDSVIWLEGNGIQRILVADDLNANPFMAQYVESNLGNGFYALKRRAMCGDE